MHLETLILTHLSGLEPENLLSQCSIKLLINVQWGRSVTGRKRVAKKIETWKNIVINKEKGGGNEGRMLEGGIQGYSKKISK